MYRYRLALLPIVAISAFLGPSVVDSPALAGVVPVANSTTSTVGDLLGDTDCSLTVDTADSLALLSLVGGVANTPCADLADVQCDDDTDVVDALQTLLFAGGFGVSQEQDCPEIGTFAGPRGDPLTVTFSLDSDLASIDAIGVQGGEMAATDANGTTFTLSIPEGALVDAEEITLTPVVSIDPLPLSGGLVGAVFVEPEDLVLAQPATLTIQTAALPAGELTPVAFGFRDGELFLTPMLPDTAQPAVIAERVSVSDGGGFGIGLGDPPDIQELLGHPANDPASRLRHKLADILRPLTGGPTPESYAQTNAALSEFYERYLRPYLPRAATECDL